MALNLLGENDVSTLKLRRCVYDKQIDELSAL